jgi:hypothetical protein
MDSIEDDTKILIIVNNVLDKYNIQIESIILAETNGKCINNTKQKYLNKSTDIVELNIIKYINKNISNYKLNKNKKMNEYFVILSVIRLLKYGESIPIVREPKYNKCYICGSNNSLKTCCNCKNAKYCSRECQVKDWKEHKKICKTLLEVL